MQQHATKHNRVLGSSTGAPTGLLFASQGHTGTRFMRRVRTLLGYSGTAWFKQESSIA